MQKFLQSNCVFEDAPVYLACSQGEVGLPKLNPDVADREGGGYKSPSPHRSHQTAQQQVRLYLWLEAVV